MNRTILGILAIAAALFLGLLAILRPATPHTPPTLPHNEAATPPPQLPTKFVPPPTRTVRTGTLLDPATEPTMANLPFTRVTLHLNDTPFMQAGAHFAQATGIPFATSWFERTDPATLPRITIHLDNAPAMEAYLQFWEQARYPINNFTTHGLSFRPTPGPPRIGTWCVCGPFAVIAVQISSTVDLAKLPPATSPLTLYMQMYADPKINVLLFPTALTFDTFLDSNSNPIKTPAAVGPSRIDRGTPYPAQLIATPLTLAATPATPPTHIKTLKGHAPVLIAGVPRTLVAKPTEPFRSDVNGLGVEVLPITKQDTTYTLDVHYRRNALPADQWPLWTAALKSLRIKINMPTQDTLSLPSLGRSQPPTPDDFTVSYLLNADEGLPASSELDIPSDIRLLQVPFEFHDLVLP